MSSSGVKNIEVLRPALAFLRQAFAYEYAHQDSAAFQQERQNLGEAILGARLLRKLRELNPDSSEAGLRQAVTLLTSPTHASLAAIQQELYDKMLAASWRTAGAPAQPESAQGTALEESKTPCHYFDFESPGRNEFLIVEQFQFAGPGGVRALDAVIFVNGIPLAVFEARAVHEPEGLRRGIEHLERLQAPQEISRLFHTIHFLVVLQKSAACYGGVAGRSEDFRAWGDCSPLGWEELRVLLRQTPHRENDVPTAQDILLAGMFPPQNLLALFRDFTAMVASPRGSEKKLARCHQYQAVQAARALLLPPASSSVRSAGGVIVHPAGTGKSYSMLWLACKLRQEAGLAHHALLLLTARHDLIDLLKAESQRRRLPHFLHLPQDAGVAQALENAKESTLVASPDQLRTAFKAYQKAGESLPPLTLAPLIVLLDEVPYGDAGEFMIDLEHAFPQAAIVAFSSFPPPAHVKARSRYLQNVIHVYTRRQAEHEGYLVPVKFEMRLPEWHVEKADTELHPPEETEEPKMREDSSYSSSPAKAESETRLRAITDDILLHFQQDIAANGNHAMLVAADARLAARYSELLIEKMPNEVLALLPERESPAAERRPRHAPVHEEEGPDPEEILQRLTANNRPLLLIVPEILRAGFSTPKLQVLYIDRPLRGLALLEAVALTQCAGNQNKTFGLLVDYWGVFNAAPEPDAAEIWANLTSRYDESQFEELRWWRRELAGLFDSYPDRDGSEAGLLALAPGEKRVAFAKAWRVFTRWLDQLLPQIRHEQIWQEACWWNHLRREAAAFYFDETMAGAHVSPKLNRWFEEDARLHGPSKIREGISVYGQDFWQELDTFKTLAAKILRLHYVLYHEIRHAAPADPVYYQALQQRIERIEIERQLGRLDDPTAFARLHEEATHLRIDKGERSRATHVLALAGILQRFMAQQEGEGQARYARHEKLASDLLTALAPETALVDWPKRQEVQREMRRKIKRLLREAGCPQSVQEQLTSELMKIIRARLGD
jgi:type I restriction enzyme R subunit